MNQTPKQNINIKIPDDVLKGVYSNNAFISHTKDEFVVDFVNISFFPPPGQGIGVSKVITSPAHFKQMLIALNDNLKKYEEKFGKINTGKAQGTALSSSTTDKPFGFAN